MERSVINYWGLKPVLRCSNPRPKFEMFALKIAHVIPYYLSVACFNICVDIYLIKTPLIVFFYVTSILINKDDKGVYKFNLRCKPAVFVSPFELQSQ